MPNAKFDYILITTPEAIDRRIIEGETRRSEFHLVGSDRSDWIPHGEIWTNYEYLGGSFLSTIEFDPSVYKLNENDNLVTAIFPVFPWELTYALPMHELRSYGGRILPSKNVWVYQIDITSPDNLQNIRVVQGYLELNPSIKVIRS